MSQRFTILRASRKASTRDPFSGGFTLQAEALQDPATISVEEATLSQSDVRDAAANPSVVGLAPVMPTRLIEPVAPPATAAAGGPWGITAVGADASPYDGAGSKVAILDTGIDAGHPAFAALQKIEQDFTGEGDGDQHGHGTHCAGIAFGGDVGGTRIGVAPGVDTALIGKVLGATGGGDTIGLARGIQWAADQGTDVISMSLGFDFPGMVASEVQQGLPITAATSRALEVYRANLRMFDRLMALLAVRASLFGGAVVVAATGNESQHQGTPVIDIGVSLPAAAEGIVAVGALDRAGTGYAVAGFSNLYPQLVAPGVRILSAKRGGGLVEMSGTSMATPHVAGIAALWWHAVRKAQQPPTAAYVTARLLAAARGGVFPGGDDLALRGAGIATAPT
ncbi:MAG: S8 family serine peptidase [Deltaproteobacteria bacterium]|nr:S8 family serine peptidase [Deltaproteobacteria bacterium]